MAGADELAASYDIVIVGAGISGATLAERYASVLEKRVLIVEKRHHIGGNCYDYRNEQNILVPLYGPHIFHTKIDRVWEYVSRFTEWHPYQHRVLSVVDEQLVPVPVNITTVNKIFGTKIEDEVGMKEWLAVNTNPFPDPKNSEESALGRVGEVLYGKMFKNYTRKQWDMWPADLGPEVMARIPVRTDHEDRYFTDPHQAMPKEGYTELFKKLLNNPLITIRLDTDWETLSKEQPSLLKFEKLFFTGKVDSYFDYKHDKLQYRSLKFVHETHMNLKKYQEAGTVNYPQSNVPWTRITEPTQMTPDDSPHTVTIKEFSTWEGEPYYPVPTPENKALYSKYQEEAAALEKDGVHFVGRLANYKYFNMDQAFDNALEVFAGLEGGDPLRGKE